MKSAMRLSWDGIIWKLLGIAVATVFLAGCQTAGLPLDARFPPVPTEIVACSQKGVSAIPDRDLSAHDVEIIWKSDRYTAVTTRQCLRRLIIRDNKLAGK